MNIVLRGFQLRYSKVLWQLAGVYLLRSATTEASPFRKVWRGGLEVAMKIKVFQEKLRVEWVNRESPSTSIRPKSEVYANHNKALNLVLRRRASACRRR